eukprot:2728469-Pyramimonas_sp.AAC.1
MADLEEGRNVSWMSSYVAMTRGRPRWSPEWRGPSPKGSECSRGQANATGAQGHQPGGSRGRSLRGGSRKCETNSRS